MIKNNNLNVNEKGNLTICSKDTTELIKEFGSPLYVMNENLIRENCKMYKDSIDKFYGGKGLILYASKAFSAKEIYKIVESEGLGCDVVSAGEIYTALKAGFNPESMCFHGNNKSYEEVKMAIENNVGRFVIDGEYDLDLVSSVAKELGKTVNIGVRIKPGIEAHTHEAIMTGQIDSKFGVTLENGEAMEFCSRVINTPNVKLTMVHCHIGSQIFELTPFIEAAKRLVNFMAEFKEKNNYLITELNLGGGFGIKYTDEDKNIAYDKYMESVSIEVKKVCDEKDFPLPFILMEPGRSIVGEAGITLYTIGSIKEIPDVRNYVAVDGGMTDNPRFALYESLYEFNIANKMNEKKNYKATIAGRCCESGDLLGKDVLIQKPQSGDILATLATGAYNYAMASSYNRIPKLPVCMVKDGNARLIVKRETFDDIIKNDL